MSRKNIDKNLLEKNDLFYYCEDLFFAARNYYMLKEMGQPYDKNEFLYDSKVQENMFRALVQYKMAQYPFEIENKAKE